MHSNLYSLSLYCSFFENFSSLLRILLFKRINYSWRLPARGYFHFSSLQSRQYICDWSQSLRKVKLYFHQFLLSSLINSSGFCTVLSTVSSCAAQYFWWYFWFWSSAHSWRKHSFSPSWIAGSEINLAFYPDLHGPLKTIEEKVGRF